MSVDRWQASADAWIEHVDGGDYLRERILDPYMLRHVTAGQPGQVVDIGCGEGRFCRMLTKRGLKPIGIEITPSLVARAIQRDPAGRYLRGSALDLPLPTAIADSLVTYIVLIDIADLKGAVQEAVRVLKPGGRWIDAHIIPFRTAADTLWIKDESGNRLHVPVVNYTEDKAIHAAWKGIDVINYHRSLSSYWRPFLEAGLHLVSLEEPIPSYEKAEHEADMRVPFGMVSVWEKR